jgi:hypothetical protein
VDLPEQAGPAGSDQTARLSPARRATLAVAGRPANIGPAYAAAVAGIPAYTAVRELTDATLDRTLPISGATMVGLIGGRGLVLHDAHGALLEVLIAVPECGARIAGAWHPVAALRSSAPIWGLAVGQAPPGQSIEVTFLRRHGSTQFLNATAATTYRLGELWIAEAAGDFTAAMLTTPSGVQPRRLQTVPAAGEPGHAHRPTLSAHAGQT